MPEYAKPDKPEEDVETIRIGNTTYEVTSFYDGEATLTDIIKNSLKRNAEAVLRQMGKE